MTFGRFDILPIPLLRKRVTDMRRQSVVLVVGIVIVVFVFAAPVQPVVGPGPCVGCDTHYLESLSCNVVPISDVYWPYSGLQVGCGPPLVA
jgi:hypothetical protein